MAAEDSTKSAMGAATSIITNATNEAAQAEQKYSERSRALAKRAAKKIAEKKGIKDIFRQAFEKAKGAAARTARAMAQAVKKAARKVATTALKVAGKATKFIPVVGPAISAACHAGAKAIDVAGKVADKTKAASLGRQGLGKSPVASKSIEAMLTGGQSKKQEQSSEMAVATKAVKAVTKKDLGMIGKMANSSYNISPSQPKQEQQERV